MIWAGRHGANALFGLKMEEPMKRPWLKWVLWVFGSLFALFVVVASAGFWFLSKQVNLTVKPGHPAPPIQMTSLSGAESTLASIKGKVLVLAFWAPW